MLVSIHQSHYLPWLRYMEKVLCSDFFILLDDVDFTRNGWQNRNKIKSAHGPQVLTVPVRGALGTCIRDMEIAPEPWARKHWAAISQAYSAAPHFAQFRSSLEEFYSRPWRRLGELNEAQFHWHLQALDCQVPCCTSTSLGVESKSTLRLVELVKAVGGTGYLTGKHGFDTYLNPEEFKRAGLELWIFEGSSPPYPQIRMKQGFVPDLAVMDLLFCTGTEESREYLRAAGKVSRWSA